MLNARSLRSDPRVSDGQHTMLNTGTGLREMLDGIASEAFLPNSRIEVYPLLIARTPLRRC